MSLLKLYANFFYDKDIRYSLVGGITVLFQGRFRTTEDIDVIILHEEPNIEEFVNYCKKNELTVDKFDLEEAFKEHPHTRINYTRETKLIMRMLFLFMYIIEIDWI